MKVWLIIFKINTVEKRINESVNKSQFEGEFDFSVHVLDENTVDVIHVSVSTSYLKLRYISRYLFKYLLLIPTPTNRIKNVYRSKTFTVYNWKIMLL